LNSLSVLLPSPEFKIHVCGNCIDGSKDISNGISYYGYLSGEAFDFFCADIDIFINPRGYSEAITSYSFPSKLYEYMSYCRPVVSTPIPHIGEGTASFINFSSDYSDEAVMNLIITIWGDYEKYLLKAKTQKSYLNNLNAGLAIFNFLKELR
tara:strand:- start:100 stop:555 length:456 start_codon:yes stop_codon:yes gene_type:complete